MTAPTMNSSSPPPLKISANSPRPSPHLQHHRRPNEQRTRTHSQCRISASQHGIFPQNRLHAAVRRVLLERPVWANTLELAGCIAWVSHGFEIVFSPFPDWRFSGADCAAAFGLHGALYLGPRLPLTQSIINQLPRFRIALEGPDGKRLTGCGADVLDGPLRALGYLLDTLATDPGATPVGEGEIITTGTLTDAMPISPGDRWTTRLDGIDLPGATIAFR